MNSRKKASINFKVCDISPIYMKDKVSTLLEPNFFRVECKHFSSFVLFFFEPKERNFYN